MMVCDGSVLVVFISISRKKPRTVAGLGVVAYSLRLRLGTGC
jgi:hypothetical protein